MVIASASSPAFFEPAVIGTDAINPSDDVYISGDNVAKSPALFAYLQAKSTKFWDGTTYDRIRVVSIGSVKDEPEDSFLTDYSLLKWTRELLKMNHQIVQNTMDYMLEAIMRKNGHPYHKFELNRDRKW